MSHIEPIANLDELAPELQSLLKLTESYMGFIPTSMLTMAHWPELLRQFNGLAATVLGQGIIDGGLKQLIAFVSSNAAGCRYCQAHTSHTALRRGVTAEKIDAAFEFETSPLFNDAERAALRIAAYGSILPNAVEASHVEALKKHFNEREIVEIMSVISLFGYLNRWNDTLATTLEAPPRQFADRALQANGWQIGKHDAANAKSREETTN